MINNLYGNPHSASDPAHLSGVTVDEIREKALRFFNANPEDFDLIFTANATASIKLVAESFRDLAAAGSTTSHFWYGYHKDAHTSLVGVRELTEGCHHCFTSDDEVEQWLDGYHAASAAQNSAGIPGLFAYPGQSNMTGRRLPLSWTEKLRRSSMPSHQSTYSLLDAAALATTTQLDFSDPETAPDFTAVSFYKIFGFPDLGALIVRKDSGHILGWRRYFGGGTVNMVTVLHEASVQRKYGSLHDNLEDGTLPFHSIIALGCAIEVHRRLYGSMKAISNHTSYLAYRLYIGMTSLSHFNGRPLCLIYNDVPMRCAYGDPVTQGATIAFNIMRADGSFVGYSIVEKSANDSGIFLRSGGLCNAGGIATYLQVEPWQFKRAWSGGHRCGEGGTDVLNGKPTGVVRASLGAMTTLADIERFLDFLILEYVEGVESFEISERLRMFHKGLDVMGNEPATFQAVVDEVDPEEPRRILSVPDLRSMKPRLFASKSFYGGQFGASSTQVFATAPILQKMQDASKSMNNVRFVGTPTRRISSPASSDTLPNIYEMQQPQRMERQKGRKLLKFWKTRKPLSEVRLNSFAPEYLNHN